MDRVLREYQRITRQYEDRIPSEVLNYIHLLEKLSSNTPELPEGLTVLTDSEMRALAVLVRFVAQRCGEDTIGAILYTGAFHQLGGLSQQPTPEEQHENDTRIVHLARTIDRFTPD